MNRHFLVSLDTMKTTSDVVECFPWGGRALIAECRDTEAASMIANALNAAGLELGPQHSIPDVARFGFYEGQKGYRG